MRIDPCSGGLRMRTASRWNCQRRPSPARWSVPHGSSKGTSAGRWNRFMWSPRTAARSRHRSMLTENHIVDAVCRHLEAHGYRTLQRLTTIERGCDIIAEKIGASVELRIEAKGETSDRSSSARYGKPFSTAQVRDHVAKAFYAAACLLDGTDGSRTVRAGFALPDTPTHRARVAQVQAAITTLGL